MTAKLVLTAPEGQSLTPVINKLRNDFPQAYQALEDRISAEAHAGGSFGASGSIDLTKVAIDINVPPEIVEQLNPIFELTLQLLSEHTNQPIDASVIIDQNGEVTEWKLKPKKRS